MSFRQSNSSFLGMLFTISSSFWMHELNRVWHYVHTCLTPRLLKRYLKKPISIVKWHLTCAHNRATTSLCPNDIRTPSFIFKAHFLVHCQRFLQFHKTTIIECCAWSQLSSMITLRLTKWSTTECFGLMVACSLS